MEEEDKRVWIISYTTQVQTTHSIAWDSIEKRILDSEKTNSQIFTYNTLSACEFKPILSALKTCIDVPCILYLGFWKERAPKTRNGKRKIVVLE